MTDTRCAQCGTLSRDLDVSNGYDVCTPCLTNAGMATRRQIQSGELTEVTLACGDTISVRTIPAIGAYRMCIHCDSRKRVTAIVLPATRAIGTEQVLATPSKPMCANCGTSKVALPYTVKDWREDHLCATCFDSYTWDLAIWHVNDMIYTRRDVLQAAANKLMSRPEPTHAELAASATLILSHYRAV